jgi:hypothetical protein
MRSYGHSHIFKLFPIVAKLEWTNDSNADLLLLLLLCSFSNALELARALGDTVWTGGALEGLACAVAMTTVSICYCQKIKNIKKEFMYCCFIFVYLT